MTVQELIDKLNKCPKDFIVVNVYEDEFDDVEIDNEEQIVVITD